MNRPIVRDMLFLGQISEPATQNDLSVSQDLQDTQMDNPNSEGSHHDQEA